MPVFVVMFFQPGHSLRNPARQFQKDTDSTPRLFTGMGKNNQIGYSCPAPGEQRFQPPPVHSPVPAAGNERNHHLIMKQPLSVPVKESQYGSAGIIGPGRAGQDNKIIPVKTVFRQFLNRSPLAKQGTHHFPERLGNRTNGKLKPAGRFDPLHPMSRKR